MTWLSPVSATDSLRIARPIGERSRDAVARTLQCHGRLCIIDSKVRGTGREITG